MGKNTSLNPGVKRILVISYCFPPQGNARAAQLFKLFKSFSQFSGLVFDVLTINPKLSSEKIDKSLTLKKSSINIHYAWSWEINQYFNYLLRKFDYLPDGKLIWRFFAQRKAFQLLNKNNYDAVVSFSQYFSSAVVGSAIKKKHSKVPLISYFSDPWLENPYFPKLSSGRREKNAKAEKQVMNLSDSIIFSNGAALTLCAKKYGKAVKSKSFVIPHAYDPNLYPESRLRRTGESREKLKIVHTGNFYGPRTPENFLLALKQLHKEKAVEPRDIEVCFYGTSAAGITNNLRRKGLEGLAVWKEPVPYLESLKIISTADLLLAIDAPLPDGQESPFLPSKLIDYFGAGKPILAITPEKGAVASLLRTLQAQRHPYFLADANGVEDIAMQLKKLIPNLKAFSQRKHPLPGQFDIRNIQEKWRTIFSSTCQKSQNNYNRVICSSLFYF